MRREILDILACPQCRGSLTLADIKQESGARILTGTLRCDDCSQQYPVSGGVPRLLEAAGDVHETGRRFEYQWEARRQGRFENQDRCYGFDHDEYARWIRDRLAAQRPLTPGDRILDAGCGTGEKAAALARFCPGQRVLGLDLTSATLRQAAADYGDLENLDFVQGNILAPPLKRGAFRWGVSIGMLHHTPDTRLALARFRGLLRDDAALLLWIYPPFQDAPEWRWMYLARDVVFLGQSPELPTKLLWPLTLLLLFGVAPIACLGWRHEGERLRKELPFFNPGSMSLREQFWALAFHLFDTLQPRYQFRHSRREVERWLAEEGCTPAYHAHGYFAAEATRPGTDRMAEAAQGIAGTRRDRSQSFSSSGIS